MMLSRRTLLVSAAALPVSLRFDAARADAVSDWVSAGHARLRLIDAGGDGGHRLAGLQIQLDPSYLTYWRTPGEAGVPPTASFEGSQNLGSATLAFPAPQRFDEGGAEAFGYRDDVVFPLHVVAEDPRKPVTLAVSLAFAICSDLCLPATAAARLDLSGPGDRPEASLVRDALRWVPVPQPLGAAGPLGIESVEPGDEPTKARVVARAPAGSVPSLFVEAPEPWYIQASQGQAAHDGRVGFDLRVLSGPKQAGRVPLVLTLVGERAAIESEAHLDVRAPTP